MNDVTCTDSVRADKNLLMHSRAKEVDGDEGSSAWSTFSIKLLAKQHLEAIQRRVFRCGNCISDYLGVDHFLDDAKIFNHDASADAGEGLGSGDALTCGGGDGVAEVAFSSESETSGG